MKTSHIYFQRHKRLKLVSCSLLFCFLATQCFTNVSFGDARISHQPLLESASLYDVEFASFKSAQEVQSLVVSSGFPKKYNQEYLQKLSRQVLEKIKYKQTSMYVGGKRLSIRETFTKGIYQVTLPLTLVNGQTSNMTLIVVDPTKDKGNVQAKKLRGIASVSGELDSFAGNKYGNGSLVYCVFKDTIIYGAKVSDIQRLDPNVKTQMMTVASIQGNTHVMLSKDYMHQEIYISTLTGIPVGKISQGSFSIAACHTEKRISPFKAKSSKATITTVNYVASGEFMQKKGSLTISETFTECWENKKLLFVVDELTKVHFYADPKTKQLTGIRREKGSYTWKNGTTDSLHIIYKENGDVEYYVKVEGNKETRYKAVFTNGKWSPSEDPLDITVVQRDGDVTTLTTSIKGANGAIVSSMQYFKTLEGTIDSQFGIHEEFKLVVNDTTREDGMVQFLVTRGDWSYRYTAELLDKTQTIENIDISSVKDIQLLERTNTSLTIYGKPATLVQRIKDRDARQGEWEELELHVARDINIKDSTIFDVYTLDHYQLLVDDCSVQKEEITAKMEDVTTYPQAVYAYQKEMKVRYLFDGTQVSSMGTRYWKKRNKDDVIQHQREGRINTETTVNYTMILQDDLPTALKDAGVVYAFAVLDNGKWKLDSAMQKGKKRKIKKFDAQIETLQMLYMLGFDDNGAIKNTGAMYSSETLQLTEDSNALYRLYGTFYREDNKVVENISTFMREDTVTLRVELEQRVKDSVTGVKVNFKEYVQCKEYIGVQVSQVDTDPIVVLNQKRYESEITIDSKKWSVELSEKTTTPVKYEITRYRQKHTVDTFLPGINEFEAIYSPTKENPLLPGKFVGFSSKKPFSPSDAQDLSLSVFFAPKSQDEVVPGQVSYSTSEEGLRALTSNRFSLQMNKNGQPFIFLVSKIQEKIEEVRALDVQEGHRDYKYSIRLTQNEKKLPILIVQKTAMDGKDAGHTMYLREKKAGKTSWNIVENDTIISLANGYTPPKKDLKVTDTRTVNKDDVTALYNNHVKSIVDKNPNDEFVMKFTEHKITRFGKEETVIACLLYNQTKKTIASAWEYIPTATNSAQKWVSITKSFTVGNEQFLGILVSQKNVSDNAGNKTLVSSYTFNYKDDLVGKAEVGKELTIVFSKEVKQKNIPSFLKNTENVPQPDNGQIEINKVVKIYTGDKDNNYKPKKEADYYQLGWETKASTAVKKKEASTAVKKKEASTAVKKKEAGTAVYIVKNKSIEGGFTSSTPVAMDQEPISGFKWVLYKNSPEQNQLRKDVPANLQVKVQGELVETKGVYTLVPVDKDPASGIIHGHVASFVNEGYPPLTVKTTVSYAEHTTTHLPVFTEKTRRFTFTGKENESYQVMIMNKKDIFIIGQKSMTTSLGELLAVNVYYEPVAEGSFIRKKIPAFAVDSKQQELGCRKLSVPRGIKINPKTGNAVVTPDGIYYTMKGKQLTSWMTSITKAVNTYNVRDEFVFGKRGTKDHILKFGRRGLVEKIQASEIYTKYKDNKDVSMELGVICYEKTKGNYDFLVTLRVTKIEAGKNKEVDGAMFELNASNKWNIAAYKHKIFKNQKIILVPSPDDANKATGSIENWKPVNENGKAIFTDHPFYGEKVTFEYRVIKNADNTIENRPFKMYMSQEVTLGTGEKIRITGICAITSNGQLGKVQYIMSSQDLYAFVTKNGSATISFAKGTTNETFDIRGLNASVLRKNSMTQKEDVVGSNLHEIVNEEMTYQDGAKVGQVKENQQGLVVIEQNKKGEIVVQFQRTHKMQNNESDCTMDQISWTKTTDGNFEETYNLQRTLTTTTILDFNGKEEKITDSFYDSDDPTKVRAARIKLYIGNIATKRVNIDKKIDTLVEDAVMVRDYLSGNIYLARKPKSNTMYHFFPGEKVPASYGSYVRTPSTNHGADVNNDRPGKGYWFSPCQYYELSEENTGSTNIGTGVFSPGYQTISPVIKKGILTKMFENATFKKGYFHVATVADPKNNPYENRHKITQYIHDNLPAQSNVNSYSHTNQRHSVNMTFTNADGTTQTIDHVYVSTVRKEYGHNEGYFTKTYVQDRLEISRIFYIPITVNGETRYFMHDVSTLNSQAQTSTTSLFSNETFIKRLRLERSKVEDPKIAAQHMKLTSNIVQLLTAGQDTFSLRKSSNVLFSQLQSRIIHARVDSGEHVGKNMVIPTPMLMDYATVEARDLESVVVKVYVLKTEQNRTTPTKKTYYVRTRDLQSLNSSSDVAAFNKRYKEYEAWYRDTFIQKSHNEIRDLFCTQQSGKSIWNTSAFTNENLNKMIEKTEALQGDLTAHSPEVQVMFIMATLLTIPNEIKQPCRDIISAISGNPDISTYDKLRTALGDKKSLLDTAGSAFKSYYGRDPEQSLPSLISYIQLADQMNIKITENHNYEFLTKKKDDNSTNMQFLINVSESLGMVLQAMREYKEHGEGPWPSVTNYINPYVGYKHYYANPFWGWFSSFNGANSPGLYIKEFEQRLSAQAQHLQVVNQYLNNPLVGKKGSNERKKFEEKLNKSLQALDWNQGYRQSQMQQYRKSYSESAYSWGREMFSHGIIIVGTCGLGKALSMTKAFSGAVEAANGLTAATRFQSVIHFMATRAFTMKTFLHSARGFALAAPFVHNFLAYTVNTWNIVFHGKSTDIFFRKGHLVTLKDFGNSMLQGASMGLKMGPMFSAIGGVSGTYLSFLHKIPVFNYVMDPLTGIIGKFANPKTFSFLGKKLHWLVKTIEGPFMFGVMTQGLIDPFAVLVAKQFDSSLKTWTNQEILEKSGLAKFISLAGMLLLPSAQFRTQNYQQILVRDVLNAKGRFDQLKRTKDPDARRALAEQINKDLVSEGFGRIFSKTELGQLSKLKGRRGWSKFRKTMQEKLLKNNKTLFAVMETQAKLLNAGGGKDAKKEGVNFQLLNEVGKTMKGKFVKHWLKSAFDQCMTGELTLAKRTQMVRVLTEVAEIIKTLHNDGKGLNQEVIVSLTQPLLETMSKVGKKLGIFQQATIELIANNLGNPGKLRKAMKDFLSVEQQFRQLVEICATLYKLKNLNSEIRAQIQEKASKIVATANKNHDAMYEKIISNVAAFNQVFELLKQSIHENISMNMLAIKSRLLVGEHLKNAVQASLNGSQQLRTFLSNYMKSLGNASPDVARMGEVLLLILQKAYIAQFASMFVEGSTKISFQQQYKASVRATMDQVCNPDSELATHMDGKYQASQLTLVRNTLKSIFDKVNNRKLDIKQLQDQYDKTADKKSKEQIQKKIEILKEDLTRYESIQSTVKDVIVRQKYAKKHFEKGNRIVRTLNAKNFTAESVAKLSHHWDMAMVLEGYTGSSKSVYKKVTSIANTLMQRVELILSDATISQEQRDIMEDQMRNLKEHFWLSWGAIKGANGKTAGALFMQTIGKFMRNSRYYTSPAENANPVKKFYDKIINSYSLQEGNTLTVNLKDKAFCESLLMANKGSIVHQLYKQYSVDLKALRSELFELSLTNQVAKDNVAELIRKLSYHITRTKMLEGETAAQSRGKEIVEKICEVAAKLNASKNKKALEQLSYATETLMDLVVAVGLESVYSTLKSTLNTYRVNNSHVVKGNHFWETWTMTELTKTKKWEDLLAKNKKIVDQTKTSGLEVEISLLGAIDIAILSALLLGKEVKGEGSLKISVEVMKEFAIRMREAASRNEIFGLRSEQLVTADIATRAGCKQLFIKELGLGKGYKIKASELSYQGINLEGLIMQLGCGEGKEDVLCASAKAMFRISGEKAIIVIITSSDVLVNQMYRNPLIQLLARQGHATALTGQHPPIPKGGKPGVYIMTPDVLKEFDLILQNGTRAERENVKSFLKNITWAAGDEAQDCFYDNPMIRDLGIGGKWKNRLTLGWYHKNQRAQAIVQVKVGLILFLELLRIIKTKKIETIADFTKYKEKYGDHVVDGLELTGSYAERIKSRLKGQLTSKELSQFEKIYKVKGKSHSLERLMNGMLDAWFLKMEGKTHFNEYTKNGGLERLISYAVANELGLARENTHFGDVVLAGLISMRGMLGKTYKSQIEGFDVLFDKRSMKGLNLEQTKKAEKEFQVAWDAQVKNLIEKLQSNVQDMNTLVEQFTVKKKIEVRLMDVMLREVVPGRNLLSSTTWFTATADGPAHLGKIINKGLYGRDANRYGKNFLHTLYVQPSHGLRHMLQERGNVLKVHVVDPAVNLSRSSCVELITGRSVVQKEVDAYFDEIVRQYSSSNVRNRKHQIAITSNSQVELDLLYEKFNYEINRGQLSNKPFWKRFKSQGCIEKLNKSFEITQEIDAYKAQNKANPSRFKLVFARTWGAGLNLGPETINMDLWILGVRGESSMYQVARRIGPRNRPQGTVHIMLSLASTDILPAEKQTLREAKQTGNEYKISHGVLNIFKRAESDIYRRQIDQFMSLGVETNFKHMMRESAQKVIQNTKVYLLPSSIQELLDPMVTQQIHKLGFDEVDLAFEDIIELQNLMRSFNLVYESTDNDHQYMNDIYGNQGILSLYLQIKQFIATKEHKKLEDMRAMLGVTISDVLSAGQWVVALVAKQDNKDAPLLDMGQIQHTSFNDLYDLVTMIDGYKLNVSTVSAQRIQDVMSSVEPYADLQLIEQLLREQNKTNFLKSIRYISPFIQRSLVSGSLEVQARNLRVLNEPRMIPERIKLGAQRFYNGVQLTVLEWRMGKISDISVGKLLAAKGKTEIEDETLTEAASIVMGKLMGVSAENRDILSSELKKVLPQVGAKSKGKTILKNKASWLQERKLKKQKGNVDYQKIKGTALELMYLQRASDLFGVWEDDTISEKDKKELQSILHLFTEGEQEQRMLQFAFADTNNEMAALFAGQSGKLKQNVIARMKKKMLLRYSRFMENNHAKKQKEIATFYAQFNVFYDKFEGVLSWDELKKFAQQYKAKVKIKEDVNVLAGRLVEVLDLDIYIEIVFDDLITKGIIAEDDIWRSAYRKLRSIAKYKGVTLNENKIFVELRKKAKEQHEKNSRFKTPEHFYTEQMLEDIENMRGELKKLPVLVREQFEQLIVAISRRSVGEEPIKALHEKILTALKEQAEDYALVGMYENVYKSLAGLREKTGSIITLSDQIKEKYGDEGINVDDVEYEDLIELYGKVVKFQETAQVLPNEMKLKFAREVAMVQEVTENIQEVEGFASQNLRYGTHCRVVVSDPTSRYVYKIPEQDEETNNRTVKVYQQAGAEILTLDELRTRAEKTPNAGLTRVVRHAETVAKNLGDENLVHIIVDERHVSIADKLKGVKGKYSDEQEVIVEVLQEEVEKLYDKGYVFIGASSRLMGENLGLNVKEQVVLLDRANVMKKNEVPEGTEVISKEHALQEVDDLFVHYAVSDAFANLVIGLIARAGREGLVKIFNTLKADDKTIPSTIEPTLHSVVSLLTEKYRALIKSKAQEFLKEYKDANINVVAYTITSEVASEIIQDKFTEITAQHINKVKSTLYPEEKPESVQESPAPAGPQSPKISPVNEQEKELLKSA